MMRRSTLAALATAAAACWAPSRAACQDAPSRASATRRLRPGDHQFSLRYGGRRRSYLVHMPATAHAPLPVLLAFHGGGGWAANFESYAELDRVADREGFVVAYPNGTGPLPNRLLTWNGGDGCCGYARQHEVDDVGFAVALVADLEARTSIDRQRIYATGHSNGAILANRLGAERADVVAAIAPVAGALDLSRFSPSAPVPVLAIHSVDDPRALYDGGLGPPFPGTNSRVYHQPVQAGLDRWIAVDGCRAAPDTLEVRRGTAGTASAGQTAILLAWRGCRGGAEVRHWKLSGSGHGWPGASRPPGGEGVSGPQTTLVRAADEVWSFVSRFRRQR